MGNTWYEALMGLRNRWVISKRTPRNLCKECLLKANCSQFCKELSIEVLGEAIDQVGIGIRINDIKINNSRQGVGVDVDITFQPDAAVEKIDLNLVVSKTSTYRSSKNRGEANAREPGKVW